MKCYYKLNSDGTISSLHKADKIGKNGVEITQEQFDEYLDIIHSVPDKEGYNPVIKLYVDGTCTVEYIVSDIQE